jgi:predicted nucleic acid-binding protein
MRSSLVGDTVFDSSALLELIYSTPLGLRLKEKLRGEEIQAHTTVLNLAEVRYVLCRRIGREEARVRVGSLLESGYLYLHEDSEVAEEAAELKCYRRLSLPDCFTIALAERISAPALFARREQELAREISTEPFDVPILFLEEVLGKI